jgi:glycolate oxidase iron-sulfur subunit
MENQRDFLLREIAKCRACRFCVDVCPTYQVSEGLETWSSFGRLQTIRHLLTGVLPLDDAFVQTLYTCLQCRRCERVCKSKGQNLEICDIIHCGRVLISARLTKGGSHGAD